MKATTKRKFNFIAGLCLIAFALVTIGQSIAVGVFANTPLLGLYVLVHSIFVFVVSCTYGVCKTVVDFSERLDTALAKKR